MTGHRAILGRLIALPLALALAAGCTTMAEVRPGAGKKATFRGYTYDQMWTAVYRVAEEHFEIREMDKARGVIKAERTFHYMQGAGNWVGIYIAPPRPGAAAYQVEVVAIGKSRAEIMGQAWESKVLRHTQFALDYPALPIP